MFFRKPKKPYSIQKVVHSENSAYINILINKARYIDNEIIQTNKSILEAQVVKIRSLFAKNTNFIAGIQKKIVESNAEKSVRWHILRLSELKKEQKKLQNEIDILTGKVWSKRINKVLRWIFFGIIIMISSMILFMGILATLYLLPIIVLVLAIILILGKITRY